MARIYGARPHLTWAVVPVLLCTVAVLLAFFPLERLAATQGQQGVVFALVVCGTYAAGAALLADEARRGHPLWRVWPLLAVAGIAMATGITDFLATTPAPLRWTSALLIPGVPALALIAYLRWRRGAVGASHGGQRSAVGERSWDSLMRRR